VAPRLCARFQDAMLEGDYTLALEFHRQLMPLHKAVFAEPGVVGAKYGLSVLGHCKADVRLPLTGALPETKAAMEAAMRFAGLIN
jgi:4-hydroxy-tetrahydrodipicolinate synthase